MSIKTLIEKKEITDLSKYVSSDGGTADTFPIWESSFKLKDSNLSKSSSGITYSGGGFFAYARTLSRPNLAGGIGYAGYSYAIDNDANLRIKEIECTYLYSTGDVVIDGSFQQVKDGIKTIFNPFSYYKEGASTGEMRITLPYMPTGTDTNKIVMDIEVSTKQDRLLNANFKMTALATATGWLNTSIETRTDQTSDFEISNSFDVVGLRTITSLLGLGLGNSFFVASSYTDLKFNIKKVTITGDNVDEDWLNGWTIDWINTPFTSPNRTQGYLIKEWNSENDGSGSNLDADKLDGLHASDFHYNHHLVAPEIYGTDANEIGMWYGGNITDSAWYPNPASGGATSLFVIGDVINNGSYVHQIECKPFKNELKFRAAGTGVVALAWEYIITDNFLYDTHFTGDHTQTGNVTATGDVTGANIVTAGLVDGIDVSVAVPLNTTHRTSTGVDHSYIDQDVQTTASPTFVNGNFTGNVQAVQVYENGTFAEIYVADNSTAQTIGTGTTYTKLTFFDSNGESSNCTSDQANNKITFTKTGKYKVSCSLNFQNDTNNTIWRIAAFLNGVEQDKIHIKRKISVAGDVGSASMTGIIDVTTTTWDLDIRARHDKAGDVDITMEYANLNVEYLGNT